MFIQYNATNVHAFPYIVYKPVTMVNKKTGKRKTVMRIAPTQAPQDIKWLKPGWNEFPKAVWEQNKNDTEIQKMLRKKIIVVMEEVVSFKKHGKTTQLVVGQDDKPIVLKFFEEKRAVQIVKETWDRDILQRWLDAETRSKVRRVLERQIEPLLSKGDDEDRDQDEDEDDEDAA